MTLFAIRTKIVPMARMRTIATAYNSHPFLSMPRVTMVTLVEFVYMNLFIFSDNYALIIEQTYGVWHTKCFPKHQPRNETELIHICHRLGYAAATSVKWRVISLPWATRAARYEKPASKVVVRNKYTPLRVNDKFTLRYVRPSRPIGHLQPWDLNDEDACDEIEINCFGTQM